MPVRFSDRADAGRQLAERLTAYARRPDVLVLALPRGGVPVAFEVASRLGVPLDLFLVRKLGFPGHEEFAIGAIASGGVRVLDDDVVRSFGVSREEIDRVTRQEEQELSRRERLYRDDRPGPAVRDRIVILVDDGLATGSTMRAAISALRLEGARRIVVAVPVAPRETCEAIGAEVDEIVCAEMPEPFRAVGMWYDDFGQTSDEEVRALLARANQARVSRTPCDSDGDGASGGW
jgi:putative phosphoribosyl transferase